MIKRKGNKTFKKILIGLSIIPIVFVGSAFVIGFYEGFTGKEITKEEPVKEDRFKPASEKVFGEGEEKKEEVKPATKEEKSQEEKVEELNKLKEKNKKEANDRINKVDIEATKLMLNILFTNHDKFQFDKIEFSSTGRLKLHLKVIDKELENSIILSKLADKEAQNDVYKFEYDNLFKILYDSILFKEGIEKGNKEEFFKEYSPSFIYNDTKGNQLLRLDNFMINRDN